ncbi:acetyltransferase [Hirsutella rhossiliensis]|uniref:Acetyltransferase n=1 Tax=Hirsutella rhossiliensis TaxID=111463 RepID=A0A9P8MXP7_9HYPO|nr:acetyltransferase [Hirsutella rhossiliensis]KAH0962309.1 acetyltransferase [Hirsutella rhossiliensis]
MTSTSPARGYTANSDAAPDPPPPLSFEVVSSSADKREALRLVADAIAQQRQVASLAIIFHPLCFVALAAACTLAWRHNSRDLGSALMAVSGLVMAYLAAVRLYTSPFLRLAETFHCDSFLAAPQGQQDLVLAARFGSDIIGTLVLRLPQRPAAEGGQPSSKVNAGGGGGLIRAWTTMLRYRNKSIGADLLRFAVAVTRSACGDDAPVAFDPDHANSPLPLLRIFTRPFRRRDEKAAKALEHALRDCDAGQGRFARGVTTDGS